MNLGLVKVGEQCSSHKNSAENMKNQSDITLFKKSKRIAMEFMNLSYYVDVGFVRKTRKNILRNINGSFADGKLIAILGPSGSGKTTLLNVLSGYVTDNISGNINVNGKPQHLKTFQYSSCYIQQDNNCLQGMLTVREMMKYTADFKLGPAVSNREKNLKINHLLKIFNIDSCLDSRIAQLSGGERKRLSIALELINNPSIMFLDEPTSGLDALAASQCIKYLKSLTSHGRTIVCTIHQPSASIFYQFDHVYLLAEGRCLYQGSTGFLVSYLKELDLQCPHYHNPADYIIELACGEHGQDPIDIMTRAIDNGKISHSINNDNNSETQPSDSTEDCIAIRSNPQYQFSILLRREFTKAKRNPSLTYLRLMVAITNSLVLGIVFWQVGNDGSKVWFNYNGILGIVLHFMMPSLMLTVLYFPTEIPVIRSELFNKWYSLKVYYCSICIVDLPVSILYCVISNLIIYPMTGQPLELYRFEMWFFVNFLISLVAQSLGLLIGSVVNIVNGAFVASAVSFPFLMLAGFGVIYRDLNAFFYTCTYLSYLRFGVEGMLGAVYGYNRKPLDCSKHICFYKYAQTFLEDMYLNASQYWTDVMVLCVFLISFKLLGYYGLKWRMKCDR